MVIELIDVASSNIAQMGYDPISDELHIRFRADSRLYKYQKVPAFVWKHFLKSKSKGEFLQKIIVPYFEFTTEK